MSTFKVPYTKISEVMIHPNADRLEVARIYDWNVVVQKGRYKAGDQVLYVPVDSILPWDLENYLFPADSKIKLRKSRVKSIKIRGVMSQGMIVAVEGYVAEKLGMDACRRMGTYHEDEDYAAQLEIVKYEPPEAEIPYQMRAKPKIRVNTNFKKYTDIENYKNYNRVFNDGEEVYVSEKLHGTSFRAGWFPNEANTLWKKFLRFIGYLPEWEFCWGSRNVQIQNKMFHKGYYPTDVYSQMVEKYDLKNKLPKGFAVYGEIVGHGIQKNYNYNCGPGEYKLYIYDVMHEGKFMDYYPYGDDNTMESMINKWGLTAVPKLYVGPFSKEVLEKYGSGDSTIPNQMIREGIVVKPTVETSCAIGRKVLKYINEEYYLKNDEGTEFH